VADSLRWSISVTPVVEMTDTDAEPHNAIHSTINQSLGASGESVCLTEFKYNFGQGSNSLLVYEGSYGSAQIPFAGDGSDVDTWYIKNTGLKTDGAVSSSTLFVTFEDIGAALNNADFDPQLFGLSAGEAILLNGFRKGDTNASLCEAQDLKLWVGSDSVYVDILCDAP